MANARNKVDNLLAIQGPKVPRYIHTSPTAVHLTSNRHGDLGVCFCTPVLANETVSFDANVFCRADTSARVPLDDIYTDIYYFYVPYRFLDENFVKVLGDKHPLDNNSYAFPKISITGIEPGGFDPSFLPFDLGWSYVEPETAGEGGDQISFDDSFNAYFLMAYWKIYDDFFRDENLDPYVDIDQLKDITLAYSSIVEADIKTIPDSLGLSRLLFAAQVNKLTDIYSRSLITPQYGDAHKIPGAALAPVITSNSVHAGGNESIWFTKGLNDAQSYPIGVYETGQHGTTYIGADNTAGPETSGSIKADPINLWSKQQLGTIQELSVAMSLQAMDFARATHGHRYIETLEALWGSSMPDYLVGRAEYLGGITTTLNNIPVLSTEASYLGQMAGNSASLFNDGGFTKTFPEPGVVLGVYCNRIYHKSAQGKAHYLNYSTLLDLPNIYVAEFGPMALMQSEIANMGSINSTTVFSYSKSWIHERMIDSCVGGIMNPNSSAQTAEGTGIDYSDFRKLWAYTDLYEHDSLDSTLGLPTFNNEWLKEDAVNVSRTMTGRLIPGAPVYSGSSRPPQYLFGFYQHCKRTNFLPPDPDPLWYIRRL